MNQPTPSRSTSVEVKASDKALTLRELQAFVDAAYLAGIGPDAVPQVMVNWTAGARSIKVSGDV